MPEKSSKRGDKFQIHTRAPRLGKLPFRGVTRHRQFRLSDLEVRAHNIVRHTSEPGSSRDGKSYSLCPALAKVLASPLLDYTKY